MSSNRRSLSKAPRTGHEFDGAIRMSPTRATNSSPRKISFASPSVSSHLSDSSTSASSPLTSSPPTSSLLRSSMVSNRASWTQSSAASVSSQNDDFFGPPPMTRNPQEYYASSPSSMTTTRIAWDDAAFSSGAPPSIPSASRQPPDVMMCGDLHHAMDDPYEIADGEESLIAAAASAAARGAQSLINSSLSVMSSITTSTSITSSTTSAPVRRNSRHVRSRCIMDGNSLSFVSLEAENYVSSDFSTQSIASLRGDASSRNRPGAFPSAQFDSIAGQL